MSDMGPGDTKAGGERKARQPSAVLNDGKAPGALRTIGEVARALDIKQHVLRYWEQQFPSLRPLQRSGGRRYYRSEDIALIGFDCGVINDVLNPPLTHIHLPADKIAANAIELLLNSIKCKEERPPRIIRISAQKIDGGSVFRI